MCTEISRIPVSAGTDHGLESDDLIPPGCHMSELPLHDSARDLLFMAETRGLVIPLILIHIYMAEFPGFPYKYDRIPLIPVHIRQESTDSHVHTKTGCHMSELPLHDSARDLLFMAETRTAEAPLNPEP